MATTKTKTKKKVPPKCKEAGSILAYTKHETKRFAKKKIKEAAVNLGGPKCNWHSRTPKKYKKTTKRKTKK